MINISGTAILAYDADRDGALGHAQIASMKDEGLHSLIWRGTDISDPEGYEYVEIPIARVVQSDDFAEIEALFNAAIASGANVFDLGVGPAPAIFGDDLAGYIHAMNLRARYLQAHPREGCFISELTDDLSDWAEQGIRTAQDLADYLDGCFEREMQKAAYA